MKNLIQVHQKQREEKEWSEKKHGTSYIPYIARVHM